MDGGRIPSQQGEGQGWLQGLCNLKQSQTITGNHVGRALRASVTVTRLAATTGPLIRGCGPPREASLPWNMESGENSAPKWSSSLGRNVGAGGTQAAMLAAVKYTGFLIGLCLKKGFGCSRLSWKTYVSFGQISQSSLGRPGRWPTRDVWHQGAGGPPRRWVAGEVTPRICQWARTQGQATSETQNDPD